MDPDDRLRADQPPAWHEALLAAREGALTRLAGLVAGGTASAEVFDAIAREVADVLGAPLVAVWRHEAGETATVAGAWSDPPGVLETGRRLPREEVESRGAAAAPIVVDGGTWGALAAEGERLSEQAEERLDGFAQLVAAMIANDERAKELARLADEQAALRRVATLVARERPPAEIFAAVAEEVGLLLGVEDTTIFRFEDDWTAIAVGDRGEREIPMPLGSRISLEGDSATALVRRTGAPARIDDFSNATGPLAEYTRKAGIGSTVGSPIVVDGRVWGAMIAATRTGELMPPTTEARMGKFTELVATAISNIQARTDLAASRARIAAAADEERRRVVRDLHDGAQQRLVHTVVTLKLATQEIPDDDQPGAALVREALANAQGTIDELRELAHGILPTALSRGGLRAGVEALADRMPVPIERDVCDERFSSAVEATAYFVVAESLTNVAKHAAASRAAVTARVEDGALRVRVRDDGVGGARPDGTGLVGLADRVAALDGRLRVESPPVGGTLLVAEIPL